MAQAQRKNTEMSRDAARTKAADSTIASLPGKTTTETVRTARLPGLETGANFTGQYLYDRFLNDKSENKADATKLDIVRMMVEALDPFKFKAIVAEMVNVAKTYYDNTVKTEKDAKVYDEENPSLNVREHAARLKTARNHQTVMRMAYGALKFCADDLAKMAGDREIGYRLIRDIGMQLLESKGINWDGTKAEGKEVRQKRGAQAEETRAMLEVQKEVPRKDNENRAAYFARIDAEVQKRMDLLAIERKEKEVTALTVKIRQLAGEHLPDIIELLIAANEAQPGSVTPTPKDVTLAADASLH